MGFDAAERIKIDELIRAALASDRAPFVRPFAALEAPPPAIGWIDPAEMRELRGDVHRPRTEEDGWDTRCLVHGSNAGARARFEHTGKRASDPPGENDIRVYFMALYRACIARRRPIFGRHTPPLSFADTTWDRVNLPIVSDDGAAGCVAGVVGRNPSRVAEPPPI